TRRRGGRSASRAVRRYAGTPMNRPLRAALWIVFALGAAACRGCILPDRNLDRQVARSEVVGTWTMTAESREHLAESTGHSCTFTLGDGGTVAYDSVETFHGSYWAGTGTWELHH